jgi:cell division protease FtsH
MPGVTSAGQREYSESTQQYIDEEITRIIKARYAKVMGLLEEKKAVVEKIARRLLEVETLGEEEFTAFLSAPAVPR